jgi:hypothetical protein
MPFHSLDKEDTETGTINCGLRTDPTNVTDLQKGHNRNATEGKNCERNFFTFFKNKEQVSWQSN